MVFLFKDDLPPYSMIPVKTTFLNTEKERKKNDTRGVEGWYDK